MLLVIEAERATWPRYHLAASRLVVAYVPAMNN